MIDDVEGDESDGVDDTQTGETRHHDEDGQRNSEYIINAIAGLTVLHVRIYHCQSP